MSSSSNTSLMLLFHFLHLLLLLVDFFWRLGGIFSFHLLINDWCFVCVPIFFGIYRLLAHAKIESVKSKVAAEERKIKKKSWFSFGWYALTSGILHILITLN